MFDFDAAVSVPFRMQPGLRKIAPGALDALAAHAAHEQPPAFTVVASRWQAPILGWAVDADGTLHELDPGTTTWPEVGDCLRALPIAWRRAALLSLAFSEDFAIIDGNDATIPWLAVALPSHWAP